MNSGLFVILRFIPALFLLFLAGCATTGSGTDDVAQEPVIETETVPSSTATIDEHLYVPEIEALRVTIDANVISDHFGNYKFELQTPHNTFTLTQNGAGSSTLYNYDTKFSGTSDAWWATTIPINAAPDPATGTYNPDQVDIIIAHIYLF